MKHLLNSLNEIRKTIDKFNQIALFLDYDGTLVPFKDRPEYATPPQTLIELLRRLVDTSNFVVSIVSGRPIADLKRMLPIKGLSFLGLHGLEIEFLGKTFVWEISKNLKPIVRKIKEKLVARFSGEEGVLIEDKVLTLALHYRMLKTEKVEPIKRDFLQIVDQENNGGLEIIDGANVLEVRPKGWNKGKAVQLALKDLGNVLPFYIGDDTTDEDAFRIIDSGITVRVSNSREKTHAKFYLRNTDEVMIFLNWLLEVKDETQSR